MAGNGTWEVVVYFEMTSRRIPLQADFAFVYRMVFGKATNVFAGAIKEALARYNKL
jgi:hypothetical protein